MKVQAVRCSGCRQAVQVVEKVRVAQVVTPYVEVSAAHAMRYYAASYYAAAGQGSWRGRVAGQPDLTVH